MADHPTIVSLIASATEIVCALGLRSHLIGISHECDYPPDVRGLPVLSGPKVDADQSSATIDREVRDIVREGLSVYRVKVDELERLKPDLIVTQDHCEVCAVSLKDVEDALCRITLHDTRVCSLHPGDLADIYRDFEKVANAAGVPERGRRLAAEVRARLGALAERVDGGSPRPRPRVAALEWLDPPMVAGGWMPELVRIAGGEPVIVTEPRRFASVTWDEVVAADPDVVAVLPCGFPVARTLRELERKELAHALARLRAVREGCCYVLDGNAYFNRPGPRIAESAEVLASVLQPERCGEFRGRYADAVAEWR